MPPICASGRRSADIERPWLRESENGFLKAPEGPGEVSERVASGRTLAVPFVVLRVQDGGVAQLRQAVERGRKRCLAFLARSSAFTRL